MMIQTYRSTIRLRNRTETWKFHGYKCSGCGPLGCNGV
jgi:hypothetical protein